MFDLLTKIRELTRQLYPTGRAFRVPQGGVKEKFNEAIISREVQLCSDSLSVLDSILPDNPNFTEEDALLWEVRLGLITNSDVSLEDRKSAIIRKINHPGTVLARQSRDYLESSLRLAGFDVYVHENIPENLIPDIPGYLSVVTLGQVNLGQVNLGALFGGNKVANYLEESKDFSFIQGSSFVNSFLIGGLVFGSEADVPLARKDEFRQLILRLKRVSSVAYLRINYI